MPELFKLKVGRKCLLQKFCIVAEAPVHDVKHGKHHHTQERDSTISLNMLFILGSAAII